MGDLQDVDLLLVVAFGERVDAHDVAVARLHLLAEAVAGLSDRTTEVALVDALDHAAHAVDLSDDRVGVGLHLIGQRFDVPRTAQRIDRAVHARLVGQDLLGAQRHADGGFRRQAERLVHRVGVQTLASAQHAGHGLVGHADDVVQRLLLGQRTAGRLHVRPHEQRAVILRAVALAHRRRPDAAGGTELADLLEELVVGVEEERQPRGEGVHVEAACDARLHVLHAVTQREGQLLRGRRTGLADVVAADGHAVPLGQMLRGVLDGVHHQLHRRLGRVDELVLGVELLEDVVLQRAAELRDVDVALPGHRDVHRPDHRGRAVDGLADRDLVDGDVGVQPVHVLDGVDGHTAAPDLAEAQGIVAVAAHQRGQIERGRQTGVHALGVLQQVLEPLVRVVGRTEAGELPHRPQPRTVHRLVHPAGEGEDARQADPLVRRRRVVRRRRGNGARTVELVDLVAREGHGRRIHAGSLVGSGIGWSVDGRHNRTNDSSRWRPPNRREVADRAVDGPQAAISRRRWSPDRGDSRHCPRPGSSPRGDRRVRRSAGDGSVRPVRTARRDG